MLPLKCPRMRDFNKQVIYICIFVQYFFFQVIEYAAKVQICKTTNTVCLQSVNAACDKVGFCDEHGAGVYDCTRLHQRRSKARD